MSKPKRPCDIRRYEELCALPRDNWSYGSAYAGFNNESEIYLGWQKIGEESKWSGTFSRRAWEYLIARYLGFPDFGTLRSALRP